jgi:hydrogenase nickel incorporation protein HypA/HybF
MHETSIVQNLFEIIDTISRENNLTKIEKVTVSIGKMRMIVPEIFQFAFDAARKDSIAHNAVLNMILVPIKIRCAQCESESIVEDNTYICPVCSSIEVEVIDGDEILITSIEGDKE